MSNNSTNQAANNPTITLSNGVQMPQLAFGTAPLASSPGECPYNPRYVGLFPERVTRSLHLALTAGIRHIDTALIYRSHPQIAFVLNQWFMEGKLTREDVFITSKIYHPPTEGFGTSETTIDLDNLTVEQVEQRTHQMFQKCLMELGVGYVDLMLLHWPSPGGGAGHSENVDDSSGSDATMAEIDPIKRAKRIAAWKVLEYYYSIGWVRAIGVSNFHEVHLQHLMEDGAIVRPHVNQIETSIYIQYERIIEYCKMNDIVVMSYSPFGRGVMNIENDEVIKSIGDKHGLSPESAGLVVLAFLFRRGFAVSFLSSSGERMKGNLGAFSLNLDEDDMERLSALQRWTSWGLPSPYKLS